jgi:acyl carrier protein phosphodiesterase
VNFLAHLYLSGDDEDIMIGNFIADGIKGNRYENYPPQIKNGILLHRFIDDFTDTHPIVLESKILLRPRYSKLAPILVDMIYDHYLAKNWAQYHPLPLREYVDKTYATLQRRNADLTPPVQKMLPYMIQFDWLYNYQFQEGMERVFLGMSRRVRSGSVLKHGWEDLAENYEALDSQFKMFFRELRMSVADKLIELETL